ncbi:nicotinamide-nucleotide adenylyltransferase [compost metagenome]
MADQVLIFVGSANVWGTIRNPFPVTLRIRIVEESVREAGLTNVMVVALDDYSDETDICFEWGKFVFKAVEDHMGFLPDLIIHGDDGRENDPVLWFDDQTRANVHFLMVPRDNTSPSGTRSREMVLENNRSEWETVVPKAVYPYFVTMQGILKSVHDKVGSNEEFN